VAANLPTNKSKSPSLSASKNSTVVSSKKAVLSNDRYLKYFKQFEKEISKLEIEYFELKNKYNECVRNTIM
jgi:hypothetical protein